MVDIEHVGTVCGCELPPDDHPKHIHACLEDCPLGEHKRDYATFVTVSVTGNVNLHSHACCLRHTLAPLEEMITLIREYERDGGQRD